MKTQFTSKNKHLLEQAITAICNRQPVDNVKINNKGVETSLLGALLEYCNMTVKPQERRYISRYINRINFDVNGYLSITHNGSIKNTDKTFEIMMVLIDRIDKRVVSRMEREERKLQQRMAELNKKQQRIRQQYERNIRAERMELERQFQTERDNCIKDFHKKSKMEEKKLSTANDAFTFGQGSIEASEERIGVRKRFLLRTKDGVKESIGTAVSFSELVVRILKQDYGFRGFMGSEIRRANDNEFIDPYEAEAFVDQCCDLVAEQTDKVYLVERFGKGLDTDSKIRVFIERHTREGDYLVCEKVINVGKDKQYRIDSKIITELKRLNTGYTDKILKIRKDLKFGNEIDVVLLRKCGEERLSSELEKKIIKDRGNLLNKLFSKG